MAGSTRPSFPSPSEPSLRRLGVGGRRGSGSDRPIQAQLVVAICVGLMLLAVPLYLLRRPSGSAASSTSAADAGVLPLDALRSAATSPKPSKPKIKLGPIQRVKCSASPTARGQEGPLCDPVSHFEDALRKAIIENDACAPRTGKQGSINYVLTVNFKTRRVTVFPGKSGDWRGPQARRAADCVKRSLPAPDWSKLRHQHQYYMVAVLATYPPPAPIPGPEGAPVF